MPQSSDPQAVTRPAPADCIGSACDRGPRRRLARDLFLLGLKETLGRDFGDGNREPGPPLASLLGRALAGISSTSPHEARLAAGASHGR
jgi:hypothetical protein